MQNDLRLESCRSTSHDRATRAERFGRLLAVLAARCCIDGVRPCHAEAISGAHHQDRRAVPGRRSDRRGCRLIAQSLSVQTGPECRWSRISRAPAAGSAPKPSPPRNPDGYTLLLGGTNVNAIIGAIYKNLGLRSDRFVRAGRGDLRRLDGARDQPARSGQDVPEFVQYAKNNPGKLKFGAPPGIYTHFAGEFFKVKTGTDILFVPYKGGRARHHRPARWAHRHGLQSEVDAAHAFQEGKLKALAVTSEAAGRSCQTRRP